MNPYLANLRAKYDALRQGIEGLQTAASEAERDLTEDELRSVKEQAEQAKALATQIEDLTAVETRNRKVAELSEAVSEPKLRSTTTAKDRDPGHYTQDSTNSFFGDMFRARQGDEEASGRLKEHNRAGLTTGAHGPGVVPPHWLTDEFETLARQTRRVANLVRYIPLGNDPRPLTLPKQITGTDAVVAEQAAENDAVAGTDAWDSDVDTVTPKVTAGKQRVSRQLVDMSSPAIDKLIYGDLMAVYNLQVENKVGAALVAAAGAAVTTFATEAGFTAASAADAVIDTAIAVRNARKLPPDALAMSVNRYGKFLKLKDTTNRPLIPADSNGPVNVFGKGQVDVDGRFEGLAVVASDGIGTGAYPESVLAFRSSDTILFESNTLKFRFEEQFGPESIVLGIWGYTAVIVRQAGKSVKRFVVTAA